MSGWIAVEDRMPEVAVDVLIAIGSRRVIYLGYRDAEGWVDTCGGRVVKVTHWMPLPAPPEAGP